jgi:hypothetical protein
MVGACLHLHGWWHSGLMYLMQIRQTLVLRLGARVIVASDQSNDKLSDGFVVSQ